MSNLLTVVDGRSTTRPGPTDLPLVGRHVLDEDALLTPIFHALADPVDAFWRDPLTAPIPVQALVPAPVLPEPRRGRHHLRREPIGPKDDRRDRPA